MKPPVEIQPSCRAVRLTRWAHERLVKLAERLREEIARNPDQYPAHAGRRLTLSDVVVLLVERHES